jgi:hypothetical protein
MTAAKAHDLNKHTPDFYWDLVEFLESKGYRRNSFDPIFYEWAQMSKQNRANPQIQERLGFTNGWEGIAAYVRTLLDHIADLTACQGESCECGGQSSTPTNTNSNADASIPCWLAPYMSAVKFSATPGSPIILDLNGDGVRTIPITDGTYFDHDGNRFAESTGWVNLEDALLVRDLNGNGQIDDGGELFGNNTLLANGQKAANGFEALAELDSNGDGVVDADDEAWDELRLWRDVNGNGVADEGELITLEEAGVAGLNTGYQNQNATDANGNQHRQTGTFNQDNGATGQMTDVWFNINPMYRVDLEAVEVPDDIAELPDYMGYSNVPDLHQAMARAESGNLQQLVEAFVAESDHSARAGMIDAIIYAWTGVADLAPDSRGGNLSDDRKLAVLEKLKGEPFRDGGNPGGVLIPPIDQAYDLLRMDFLATPSLQSHYAELFGILRFDSIKTMYKEFYDSFLPFEDFVGKLDELYNDTSGTGAGVIEDFLSCVAHFQLDGHYYLTQFRDYAIDSHYHNAEAGSFEYFILTNIFNRISGAGVINGGASDDLLRGSAGNDTMDGGAGNDVLWGDAGDDILNGDTGDDTYVYNLVLACNNKLEYI